LTLGDTQYRWLASTLANSTARYKFVFIHNLVGGLDGQMRGGIELRRSLNGVVRIWMVVMVLRVNVLAGRCRFISCWCKIT